MKKESRKKTKIKYLMVILFVALLLRLWGISKVPVSLFGDELDVGYHAYSVLKTGRDYYGNLMPLHFQSIAEWRTPLYLYSCIPSVALFGISPLGVRLPAVIFGVLGVLGIYLLTKKITDDEAVSLVSALVLAFSPWHIQYSRAAFEVTQLLVFIIFGLYFFFRSLKEGKYLWVGVALLVLSPLVYSTAKLFVPVLMVLLFIMYKKEIFTLSKKHLMYAIVAGLILGAPTAYSTFFGGGGQRFSYISVFSDTTLETQIGEMRSRDMRMHDESDILPQKIMLGRFFHNKVFFWTGKITENYLTTFSTEFLFLKGDPNLRHSPDGMGQFYKIEALALIVGACLFFIKFAGKRRKYLVFFLIFAGAFPAALTQGGGNHATRLILILPPICILIAWGIVHGIRISGSKGRKLILYLYSGLWILSFFFYSHNYWVHYPWDSERWWHAGLKEAVRTVRALEKNYDKIIISMEGEPAWIFFAGWYEYPPDKWQAEFPIESEIYLEGFGKISHTGKYYFGSVSAEMGGFYALPSYINEKTLYLATAKEVGTNLIEEPGRSPPGLELIYTTSYPSGDPAYYLFSKDK